MLIGALRSLTIKSSNQCFMRSLLLHLLTALYIIYIHVIILLYGIGPYEIIVNALIVKC